MKISMCHYSYHRLWEEKGWDCDTLAAEVAKLGIEGIDFHAGLMGSTDGAVEKIKGALEKTGLELSGLSLSTNFNQDDPAAMKEQMDNAVAWMQVAKEVGAPVSRVFGGHIKDRTDREVLAKSLGKIVDALGDLANEAEKLDLVLALENHGGLPCTGEEQVDVIEKVNSKCLRATVDVGNYMACGQEGHVGTKIAVPYAAYVHFKDFAVVPDGSGGTKLRACVVGQGDVDHAKCLKILKDAGYDGFVAIEYEGEEDEITGVPESTEFTKKMVRSL